MEIKRGYSRGTPCPCGTPFLRGDFSS